MLRLLIFFLATFSLAVLAPSFAEPPKDLPLVEAVECRPRGGWPNFEAKLQRGGDARIAYLGGSITAQNGWRPKSLALLQSLYPKAKLSEINAAIGGTGSDLGVFRLHRDVLQHRPDLLFVEFAVNDGGAPPDQIYRCMEGIVRQTWRELPDCDICFVYTVTEALVPPLLEGKFQRSASAMEQVAEHYGIPSIHLAMEVAQLAKESRLVWKGTLPKKDEEKAALGDKVVFAPDSVHPHPETGHELYLKAIERSLPAIEAASTQAGAHQLPPPLVAGNYERAKLIPLTLEMVGTGFTPIDPAKDPVGRQFAARMQSLFRAEKAGTTLAFQFKGTRCAVYDLLGPACGQVTVTLDDQPPKIVRRFDPYSTYYRLATLLIGSELEDKVHTVKIEIHPEQPDKAKILSELGNSIDKPERFEGTAFYPGALLIVGELQ